MTQLPNKIAVEQAILELFDAIDDGDPQSVAGKFTENGLWHRRDGEKVGTAAIVSEMRRRPHGRRIQHLISNVVVINAGVGVSEVTFKTLAFSDEHPTADAPSALTHPIALDVYRATLVERGGAWLVTHLRADRLFAAE